MGLLLLLAMPAAAQHLQMKIGGGFASHHADAKLVGAFKAGLGYEIELSQHLTVTPWLTAYAKGWKDKDQVVKYYDEHGNPILNADGTQRTGIKSRTTSANYLEVPVLFNYYLRLDESRYVVLSAGPYAALGINGQQKTRGDAEQEGSRKVFYKTSTFKGAGVHRFDAGLTVGVGFQFPTHITVGVETDFGLLSFDKSGARNVSGLITLGYQF